MTVFAVAARAGLLAASCASLMASAPALAAVQPAFSLTLYDQPDYRGGSVTFYGDNANIGSTGFASRARSAQIRGTWRLCEGGGYRNRCEVLSSNIRDLDALGFGGRVGSAQRLSGAAAPAPLPYAQPSAPAPYASRPYEAYPADLPPAVDAPLAAPGLFGRAYGPPAAAAPPAPYAQAPFVSNAYGSDPAPGSTSVFFPAPTLRGADISAWTPRGAADGFCRTQGLGAAIYFDRSQTLPRAVDIEGRPVGQGPVLRDVLCRR